MKSDGKIELCKIYIIDNQPLYRAALRLALEPEYAIVGETHLSSRAWQDVESILPDIVFIDAGLPVKSGFAVSRDISLHCPGSAVIILSASPDEEQLFAAIKCGAAAFLSKNSTAEELKRVIDNVSKGLYPINDSLLQNPAAAQRVLQMFQTLSGNGQVLQSLVTPLSPRESEILRYIAEGNSNKLIAAALGIGEQTIKNYITSIMRKLNANDRTHAVVLALRHGWLNITDEPESAASCSRYVEPGSMPTRA
ncbi:LuxR C-terminal-related transcriptional regulator [Chloroflexota bacterium]